MLDPLVEYPAPAFTDRIHFEERSDGLPSQGRWQMGMATRGPQRRRARSTSSCRRPDSVRPMPWVVLQTADGWQRWDAVKWPEAKLDYGDVGVADFDRDGNLDIVITCHFLRTYVLYGNGKGDFTRFVELPQVNPNVTSRALVVADFDGDGRQDVAALAELDLDLATNVQLRAASSRSCLNTKEGWQAVDVL